MRRTNTRPAAVFECLEPRQLFAASITVKSITTPTKTLGPNQPLTATVTLANGGTDVGLFADAEVFLVPQGGTVDVKNDKALPLFNLKPVFGGGTRSLTRTAVLKNVAAGSYTLVGVLLKQTDHTPDTTTAVNGPTVTFVTPPAANSLAAGLSFPTPPSTITAGTRLSPTLTLTNSARTALSKQKVPITFYLSTDRTLSSKDIRIGTETLSGVSLPASKAKTFNLHATIPATKSPHGTYYLIAQINRGGTNPSLPTSVVAVAPTAFDIA